MNEEIVLLNHKISCMAGYLRDYDIEFDRLRAAWSEEKSKLEVIIANLKTENKDLHSRLGDRGFW